MTHSTALELLKDARSYLSALHGSVARHDQLAANLGCGGCELRDRITAALPQLATASPAGRCANDTDGDGNCAACAHNPEAPCRQPLPDRAAALTDTDRQFLTFALGLAADHMASHSDEFGDEDQAAIESLRAMTAVSSSGGAALLHETADALWNHPRASAIDSDFRAAADFVRAMATDGSRVAAEEQPAETHSCRNCEGIDPDTCLFNPNRPPEQCPSSEFDGYGLQCQKPAGHNLCTFEEEAATADEPRAVTHAKAVWEIRNAARRLYADAGIRVLDALEEQPETPSIRLARASVEAMVATVTGERPVVGEQPDTQETRPCDGCGHTAHPAHQCPVTRYGERCACDEPVAAS